MWNYLTRGPVLSAMFRCRKSIITVNFFGSLFLRQKCQRVHLHYCTSKTYDHHRMLKIVHHVPSKHTENQTNT